MSATEAEPSVFPATSAPREPGAASTACRNPRWRSSMTDAVVKIAANRTTMTTTPGKKNARYGTSAPGRRNVSPNPLPITSQKITGCPSAPASLEGCRKKRTRSRRARTSAVATS